jgi:hypothetical protein
MYRARARLRDGGIGEWTDHNWVRRIDKGLPRYNDLAIGELADTFILSGAEDLVPLLRRDQNEDA